MWIAQCSRAHLMVGEAKGESFQEYSEAALWDM
jgi:hypothetical protein